MELEKYLSPLIKWWWLIAAATIVALIGSFLATLQQTATYKSRTTLMVGSSINNLNPSSGDVYLSQYLAGVYADFVNREPIQQATKEALGIEWLPDYTARVIPNSQIIEITVTANRPENSKIVAEELAHQLILQSPSSGIENQQRQEFIDSQLNIIEGQIQDTRTAIEDLQQLLPSLNSARQIADTQSQIEALSQKLDTLQANYANLLSSTPQGAANTLTILEPAQLGYPDIPNKFIPILLAAAIGFSLATGTAYLLEYLDKTIKTIDEIKNITNAPILGYIPEIPKNNNKLLFVTENPRSPISDAFRSLRTNIELLSPDSKTVLITGTTISEGKSTIAVNYAQILTQANKKVILIDGDLRKSVLNEALGFPKHLGLSQILQGKYNLKEISIPLKKGVGLVIPSGPPPDNPTELLASEMMTQTLSSLKKMAEKIIIDGPPLFVSDATVLANQADGIILVVQIGMTRRDVIIELIEQVQRTNKKIIGVVINKAAKRSNYYTQYYGNYYNIADNDKNENSSKDTAEESLVDPQNDDSVD